MPRSDIAANTQDQLENANLIVAVCTLLSVIAFLTFAGAILEDLIPVKPFDQDAIASKYTLPFEEFRPEPVERMQYVSSVLLFLPLCTCFYWLYRQAVSKLSEIWIWRITQFLSLLMPFLVIELVWGAFKRVGIPFFHTAGILQRPLLTLAGASGLGLLRTARIVPAWWQKQKWWKESIYFGFGCGVIFLLMLAGIFNEADPWVNKTHFLAYYDAVVQAYLGKVVLVNNSAQYGLYPAFLAPLFHLIHPPTILAFTLVIAVLLAIGYCSLLVFLRLALRSRMIAFCTFLTIAFYTRFGTTAYFGSEPYFQYIPHRILFPMSFLLLAWLYLTARDGRLRRALFCVLSVTTALAVLWSMDTGIIVLGGWGFLLIVQALARVKALGARQIVMALSRRGLAALGLFLGTVLAFSVYLYILSGTWPAWQNLTQYSDLFYQAGFFMAPMPGLVYPWALLILVYMVALYQLVRFLFEHDQGSTAHTELNASRQIIFGATAVLGVGLFSYYQGRSAEENLIGLSWPSLLLIGAFADKMWEGIKSNPALRLAQRRLFENAGNAILFCCLFVFLFGSIPAMIDAYPHYMEIVASRQEKIRSGLPPSLLRQLEFIRANTRPGDPVLILSGNAPVLYLYSGFPRPLDVPGFAEIMLNSDYAQIEGFLANPPQDGKVFFDITFTQYPQFIPAKYAGLEARETLEGDGFILYTKK